MKKLVLASPALLLLLALPQPALAQSAQGTVQVTGFVTGRCSIDSGGTLGPSATGTIALGELAGSDGRLSTPLAGASIPGAQLAFRVVCNDVSPIVELSATRLVNAAAAAAGYANSVSYTADVAVAQAAGSTATLTYRATNPPNPPVVRNDLGRLANAPNNVVVRVHSLGTPAGELLVAGDYTGTIIFTVTPSA